MSDRSRIDWVDASINPWGWGCYGPGGSAAHPQLCSYCYAKRLAKRKLRKCPDCQAFRPHWHPDELQKPLHWKRPRRIFVESMGDPFGDWVTREQMGEVLATMAGTLQHTYYMLTKRPERILAMLGNVTPTVLPNLWIGASVTNEDAGNHAWNYMPSVLFAGWHTFMSVEPLLGPIDPAWLGWAQWIIVGAMSGPGAKDHQPDAHWAWRVIDDCIAEKRPVFVKRSLAHISSRQRFPV